MNSIMHNVPLTLFSKTVNGFIMPLTETVNGGAYE